MFSDLHGHPTGDKVGYERNDGKPYYEWPQWRIDGYTD